jgi:hypothetical protein
MLYLTTFGSSVWHGPAAGVPNAFEDVYPLNPLGAPRITWVTPNGGSIFSRAEPVRLIAAAAVVSGGINQVEFFQNRMSLGFGEPIPIPPAGRTAAHGAGYRYFVLVWSNPPAGTYNLKAQVTDTAGAVTLSGNVKIVVN